MAERDEDGFLERWSRRKRGEPAPGAPEIETTETAEVPSEPARPSGGRSGPPSARARAASRKPDDAGDPGDPDDIGDPEVIAKLPDIDSLDESSDFTAFLQDGVPEMIRRKALRRLWRLNPVFAVLDGLNDYDEDFSAGGIIAENIKTIYKVGKGYLDEDEDKDDTDTEAEVVEERAPDSEDPAEPAPGIGQPERGDPVEMALVSRVERESVPTSPTDGDAVPAPSKPARGSALARRWGRSSDKG